MLGAHSHVALVGHCSQCCTLLYQGEDGLQALPEERQELHMDDEEIPDDGCFVVDQDLIFIFAKSHVTIQSHYLNRELTIYTVLGEAEDFGKCIRVIYVDAGVDPRTSRGCLGRSGWVITNKSRLIFIIFSEIYLMRDFNKSRLIFIISPNCL